MSNPSSFHSVTEPPSDAELAMIARILHGAAGIVIAPGKGSMVQSRLAKRLLALGLSDYSAYIRLVESSEGVDERRNMISALTTNVTHFFRENHHFETLRAKALPELLTAARAGKKIRIWSAGSSNGQEAYSIAMTLAELASDLDRLDLRILATDIDPVMIGRGRAALYDESALEPVSAALRTKYFTKEDGGYRVVERLRNLVRFHELNLHHAWPMKGTFDIIFCRNVVIYFDAEAQDLLWRRFESVLSPGGWMFVGHSERIGLETGSLLVTAGITTYRLPPARSSEGVSAWH